MKCDRCDSEATVHEVTLHKGKKVEKHLCEQCAKGDGISVQPQASITQALTKFELTTPTAKTPQPKQQCPTCSMTFAEFRQLSQLGCPDCYREFEEHLSGLLERAHEGGTHHVGKNPTRAGASIDRQHLLAALRRKLTEAVKSEQYEKAARLRDELRANGLEPTRGADAEQHDRSGEESGSQA